MFVIVRSEFIPALRSRFAAEPDIQIFSETDSLSALDAILRHRPKVVAIDSAFAASSRGAALIARVRSDRQLASTDLRILVQDDTGLPALLGESVPSIDAASRPLDRCGTRRAARFRMGADAVVYINGQLSRLVNLSVTGAQVLCPARLQPKQGIRVLLPDVSSGLRLAATIAWSAVEAVGSALSYRAGVEFSNADPKRIDEYCTQHGASPDRLFSKPESAAPSADPRVPSHRNA